MNDYVLIQEKNQGMGQIAVNKSVVEHIVFQTVREDEHIFLMNKKSITIENLDEHLEINVNVRVEYGQNVELSARKLQKRLQENLSLMIDYNETTINVGVSGFKFD